MADNTFFVYDLLYTNRRFYLCIIGVLTVMFLSGLCFYSFICLVFTSCGWAPIFPFFIYMDFFLPSHIH